MKTRYEKLEDAANKIVAERKQSLQRRFPEIKIKGVCLSFENGYCGQDVSVRMLVFFDDWNRTGYGKTFDEAWKSVINEIAEYLATKQ